jgi:Putative adhesin
MSRFPYPITIMVAALVLAAGAAQAENFHQQVAADPRGEVDVSNISGSVVITAWDRPEVSVSADLSSDSQRVKILTGGGHTRVCVAYGDSNGCNSSGYSGDGGSVRLEIQVPRQSELDVSAVSADINSSGVAGTQRLQTVSGDINAELGSGNDEVNSVSGAVILHGNAQDGTLHAGSVSGDLRITNVAGELDARTVNGSLTAELSVARQVQLHTTSGDIELSAALASGGTIETETVSGHQGLNVSGPAGYTYEAKTFSGDIKNCFGQRSERSEYGPGDRLEGTRGGGAGHVRMQSMSGDVSLCDR